MALKLKQKKSVRQSRGRQRQAEVRRRPQVSRIKRLVVVRHSERLDKVFPDVFGPRRYTHTDSNQPLHLPIRGRVFRDYQADPPLTVNGRHLASKLHESLNEAHIVPSIVLSSPALRCVETASFLLQQGQRLSIEPALHENWVTQQGVEPNDAYLTPAQYVAAGFTIDTAYVPTQRLITVNRENPQAYFRQFSRSLDVLIASADREHPGGTLLLVAHSSTLDAVYGHFIEGGLEAFDDEGEYIGKFVREPAYTQAMVLERTRNGSWVYRDGLIKSYTTTGFTTSNQLREEDGDEEDEENGD